MVERECDVPIPKKAATHFEKKTVVVHSNGTLEVRTLKNFSQVDELS
jgi:hypothetical protein